MKKWLLIVLLLIISFGCWFLIEAYWGGLDLSGTWNTQYLETSDSETQIIRTEYFDLKTPSNWIHIFNGSGEEGDPYGIFLTGNGTIHYEYGIWAGSYSPQDSSYNEIYDLTVVEDSIGRFLVNIASNQSSETGLSIIAQHEMTRHFILFTNEGVTNNLEEIKKGVSELEFHK